MDPFDLSGRVAVVTGASSGLGSRFAMTLVAAGAEVVAAARRIDRLEALAEECEGISIRQCDVSVESQCRDLIASAVDQYGHVDILVNNAGRSLPMKAEVESTLDFRSTVEVNLIAPFTLARETAYYMLKQESGGVIVNIASMLGLVGIGRIPQASYAASKGGLINLTRELAAQWARRGIRVNAIAPGWFPTEMTEDLFRTDDGLHWIERSTPMARGGEMSELDGALLYLASDASSYVTGTVLVVDGGWTAV